MENALEFNLIRSFFFSAEQKKKASEVIVFQTHTSIAPYNLRKHTFRCLRLVPP